MEIYDVVIIGGGPIGLYAACRAGSAGASCLLIESRLNFGGVMAAAYPEKKVLNFPGFPALEGRTIIANLLERVKSLGVKMRLGEYVRLVSAENSILTAKTSKRLYRSYSIIIATGLKAQYADFYDCINVDNWDGSGILNQWLPTRQLTGKKIAVIYGLDSGLIIPDEMRQILRKLIIVGGPEIFGPVSESTEYFSHPWCLKGITGDKVPQRIELINRDTGEDRSIEVDFIFSQFKEISRQTVFSSFGIEMVGQQIKVDKQMRTNKSGVYAIGDIAWYPGKVMLLAAEAREAEAAVRNALSTIKNKYQ